MLTRTRIDIRPAEPRHAWSIYDLKAEAFGSTSLPYTIYRDPRSARYIAWLLRRGPESTGNHLYVVGDPEPIGYYHAVAQKNETFFLNYIAVAESNRGQGLGDALLDHFERTGRDLGHRTLSLEALSRDGSAVEWYKRRGYWFRSSTYHLRVPLDGLSALDGVLLTGSLWEEFRARRRERRLGFSKVDYRAINTLLTVGLIGERDCKLLSYPVDLDFAAGSIVRTFHGERETLIVSGLSALPKDWALDRWDRALRMEKRVDTP